MSVYRRWRASHVKLQFVATLRDQVGSVLHAGAEQKGGCSISGRDLVIAAKVAHDKRRLYTVRINIHRVTTCAICLLSFTSRLATYHISWCIWLKPNVSLYTRGWNHSWNQNSYSLKTVYFEKTINTSENFLMVLEHWRQNWLKRWLMCQWNCSFCIAFL